MRRTTASAAFAMVLVAAACAGPGAATTTMPPTQPTTPRSTTTARPPTPSPKPTEKTLKQAFARTSPAVVRLEGVTCDGYITGTGFLVGSSLVVTAAHVVRDDLWLRVIHDRTATQATVVGLDADEDVALAVTDTPLGSSHLSFATRPAASGDAVATVGYSLGGQLSFHAGTVNGTGRKADIEGRVATGLVEHDAAALPGDSGAPLIDVDGAVVGIHDAGLRGEAGQRLAVSAAVAAALVRTWRAAPRRQASTPGCDSAFDIEGEPVKSSDFAAFDQEAVHSLSIYFTAIDDGDYPRAAAEFARPPDPATLERGSSSSQSSERRLLGMSEASDGPVAWVTFVSHQKAGLGPTSRPEETCTVWSLDYHFSRMRGLPLIRKAVAHEGTPINRPCD